MLLFWATTLLLLLNASVSAMEPTDYFGGNNHEDYLSWFNANGASSYEASIYMSSSGNPETSKNGVSVHWNLHEDEGYIELAVAARASGWISVGLSENGGMIGTDAFVFEMAHNTTVRDTHITSLAGPVDDECSNWEFVDYTQSGEFLIVQVKRTLNTGDPQDRVIMPDGIRELPQTLLVAAWGDSPTIGYHGTSNRARGRVRFFANAVAGADEFFPIMEAESSGKFALTSRNHVIEPIVTDYVDICYSWDDVLALVCSRWDVGFCQVHIPHSAALPSGSSRQTFPGHWVPSSN